MLDYRETYRNVDKKLHDNKSGENNDNFKLGRLEPSETKLGDNKLVGRDYMVTLGLFNPIKYQINNYLNYNMKDFDDNFRSLHLIKHRSGIAGLAKAMWFDGIGNKFSELPKPGTPEFNSLIKTK